MNLPPSTAAARAPPPAEPLSHRVDRLAEELAATIKDAQAQFHKEHDVILLEFEAARAQLHTEYSQRFLDVDRELQAVREERAVLNRDRSAARQSDVVTINVGGELFTVKRETLCMCPGSFMAELFSGRWEHGLQKDTQGNAFLDLDPAVFALVLGWLRDRKIETPDRPAQPPVVPAEDLQHFQAAVDYLGLRPYLQMPGLGPDSWGAAAAPSAPGRRGSEGADVEAEPEGAGARGEGVSFLEAAGSLFASLTGAAAGGGDADGGGGGAADAEAGAASGFPDLWSSSLGGGGPAASSRSGGGGGGAPDPMERRVAWSQRFSHPAVGRLDANACAIASIGDTSAHGTAAAARATRGYQSGVHYWEVKVLACSDWSYVGFVSSEWASVHMPVGCAPQSWGVASSGVVFACGAEGARLPAGYGEGSTVGVLLELGTLQHQRVASLVVDGRRYDHVFSGLPETLYPAVSNSHVPAKYGLMWSATPPPAHGAAAGTPAPGGPHRRYAGVSALEEESEDEFRVDLS